MQSIDALRGFDMFFIIGGGALIAALAKAFPSEVSEFAAAQMAHVKWNGFAFIDMVFPLFLFLAGVSFPFSYAKNRELGMDKRAVFCKIFKRAAILAMLGVVYNGFFKFDFENLRICSVLGRIGIAWAAGACLYVLFDVRKRIFICAAILLGYWGVMSIGGYDFETNFVGAFDRRFMVGRLYQKTFDPKGCCPRFLRFPPRFWGFSRGKSCVGKNIRKRGAPFFSPQSALRSPRSDCVGISQCP